MRRTLDDPADVRLQDLTHSDHLDWSEFPSLFDRGHGKKREDVILTGVPEGRVVEVDLGSLYSRNPLTSLVPVADGCPLCKETTPSRGEDPDLHGFGPRFDTKSV